MVRFGIESYYSWKKLHKGHTAIYVVLQMVLVYLSRWHGRLIGDWVCASLVLVFGNSALAILALKTIAGWPWLLKPEHRGPNREGVLATLVTFFLVVGIAALMWLLQGVALGELRLFP